MAPFFSLSNLFLQYSFLFFSCAFLLYHSSGIQQHPLCDDSDRSSLLQFKQSFVFDDFYCDPSTDYSKIDSWKVGDDCCSWDGVHCDDQTGHVIGLDLSDSCLFGFINSDSPLFQLVHLKNLDLSLNNFNLSRIPEGILSLSGLTHLNLSTSNISGQIPLQVLQLSKLVLLDLSQNQLMLHNKSGLKDVAETLADLAQLHLGDVNISSDVPQNMSNLTSLTSLFLENCSLHGEFPPSIFQLPNLRLLSLQNNPNLTGYLPNFQAGSPLEMLSLEATNFSGQLPLSIGNLSSLRAFNATECYFEGLIPYSIGNLTKLTVLDLSKNSFSGKIPSSLSNLRGLTDFSLSNNNFSSGKLDWLGNLTNLQTLDFRRTNSYGVIPSSFRNLTQLSELKLASNHLTGQIPSWLGNLTRLKKLSFAGNELQGPIPDSMFGIPTIEAIGLRSNNLSGSLRYGSFLQSKYLSILELSTNNLSLVNDAYTNDTLPKFQILRLGGCHLKEFPSFLSEQHELKALELFHNHITGYVPSWIFSLERLNSLRLASNFLKGIEHSQSDALTSSNLQYVDFSFNELEGPLPKPPPSIVIYDVAQNNFSGDISLLFYNLTSLMVLDLSNNNLSGNLSLSLANLGSSVVFLSLRNNSLSGKIPDNFTSSCALKLIDFSHNKIEGKVPRSLVNCSVLEILNLAKNEMNDVFPSWLGSLPHLRILSLKSNKFHGAISQPLRKLEFKRLQIIDLSDNSFIGKFPLEYIQKLVAMKSVDYAHLKYMDVCTRFDKDGYMWNKRYPYFITIVNKGTERPYGHILEFLVVVDLSNNKFEGDIPEIVGTLEALNSLNLSNNILTGHIPSSLANLKYLEALDLSQNELSGEIPPQLSVLTSLSSFNVSHNNLTGPIPQGNQFGTFENDSFLANPGLCGIPLSKRCGETGTPSLPPSEDGDKESLIVWNWEIVLIGLGTGLVIGVAFGCVMDTKKYERFVRRKFARWESMNTLSKGSSQGGKAAGETD